MIATMLGQDVWTYVRSTPELFRPGGLFYRQVARDLGLQDKKHARLPAIPDKVRNTCLWIVPSRPPPPNPESPLSMSSLFGRARL